MGDPFVVGQRVVVRDAWGELRPATVVRVPREWRSRRGAFAGSDVVTTRGKFAKSWIRVRRADGSDGSPTPWPLEDVLTALPTQRAS